MPDSFRTKQIEHRSSAGLPEEPAGETESACESALDLLRRRSATKSTTQLDIGLRQVSKLASDPTVKGGSTTPANALIVDAHFSGHPVRHRIPLTPGQELQVDFGRLGLVPDGERRRVCPRPDLHGRLEPPPVRLADVPPDDRGGHQRLRGGLELLRRRVPRRHPRQHEVDRHHGREHRAADQRRFHGVRPVPRLRHRRGQGGHSHRQITRARRALRAAQLLRRRVLHRLADCRAAPRPGVRPRRACASTARRSVGPSRRFGAKSSRCSCPGPAHPSTCPPGPIATMLANWVPRLLGSSTLV